VATLAASPAPLARRPMARAHWPEYEEALRDASAVTFCADSGGGRTTSCAPKEPTMRKLIRENRRPSDHIRARAVSASDLARALQLDAKFHQLQIGLVDGVVAAVAERRRVLRGAHGGPAGLRPPSRRAANTHRR